METRDTKLCQESFIDTSFLVLYILRKTLCAPSPKNFQKTKKHHFQRVWTFVFELNLALAPFSKKVAITNF